MHIFISIIHVLVCIFLIIIVLLQRGKGASMGAAFGGSSQTLFGSSGPGTLLGKMTTAVAVVFMLTSLWLAYFAVHKGSSVMQGNGSRHRSSRLRPLRLHRRLPRRRRNSVPVLTKTPEQANHFTHKCRSGGIW